MSLLNQDHAIGAFYELTLEDYQSLILASGGLSDLASGDSGRINKFVQAGGTIFTFAQPSGGDYSLLPGDIEAIGWDENEYTNNASAEIVNWHPMFSKLNKTTANLSSDGYFTKVPENATVLARNNQRNGQPIIVSYPYGNGQVIATTLYTDYAYGDDAL